MHAVDEARLGPLCYCGNVHDLRSVDDLIDRHFACLAAVRAARGTDESSTHQATGLHFSESLSRELLASPARRRDLAAEMRARGLEATTLNAFPQGDFHAPRVKEAVYSPDWREPERLSRTLELAAILAALPFCGSFQSISTLPLGWGAWNEAAEDEAAAALRRCARGLADIAEATGRLIVLAIEPEPGCALQTTPDLLRFFAERLLDGEDDLLVRRHLGVCFDVCHQAVHHEDVVASLEAIRGAGIAVPKIQISTALALDEPQSRPEALRELARYDEPRYLHQVVARRRDGGLEFFAELADYLRIASSRDDLSLRCHFHVPVHRETMGTLATTRPELESLLDHLRDRPFAAHLEVETYTWGVLPRHGAGPVESLAIGLAAELDFVASRLRPV